MDPELLKASGYHPTDIRIACLKGYRLKLGARATLISEISHETWGAVISLKENELAELYSAPSVSDYRAVKVKCTAQDGDNIDTEVYILPEDYPFSPPVDATYAKQLLDICQKLKLPISYQNEIKNLIKGIEEEKC